MFTTHKPFKFPIQLDEDSTVWRGVELMLNTPWLIITVEDEQETSRTFLLNGTDDLLHFAERSNLGSLIEVRLVLPPGWAPSHDWTFVPVCRVERELRTLAGAIPRAVLTSREGQRYEGFPIRPTNRDSSELAVLVELPEATK